MTFRWSKQTTGLISKMALTAGKAKDSSGSTTQSRSSSEFRWCGRASLWPLTTCLSTLRTGRWIIVGTSVYKLALLPVLALAIVELVGLTGVSFAVVILFAATPASPSTYVMARQLGGDARLMAGIVTAQTALSVLSMSAVLIWIGRAAAP